MPHPGDINLELDHYLDSLKRYNIDYGPRSQNVGGTGGQNFQVRSSTSAPGFGYVNPETDELFPLYPNDPSGQGSKYGGIQQSQFHDYLGSIGAQQAQIKPDFMIDRSSNEFGYTYRPWDTLYHGKRMDTGGRKLSEINVGEEGLSYGQLFNSLDALKASRTPNYSFGQNVDVGAGDYGASYGGYVLPGGEGGGHSLLGFGDTADEVFTYAPLLQRQYYENLFSGDQEKNAP